MNLLLYIVTRLAMAVAALISVDALAGTTLAAEATSIAAAFTLIVVTEIMIDANTKS